MVAAPEWVAHDPFGVVKASDAIDAPEGRCTSERVSVVAARNGYVSVRVIVSGAGSYRLAVEMPEPFEADLFRCWYHRMAGDGEPARYCPDALVPVTLPTEAQLPDPDNAIEGQTHQEYWLDVFVPQDAPVGQHEGRVVLSADGEQVVLPISLTVAEAVVSDENAITCDHNSYGCRWVEKLYPDAWSDCRDEADRVDLAIEILHGYYRLCHEHRGLFSNLGAGHAGSFDSIYGPRAVGAGRDKELVDWDLYDRHYGPLLDGSLFASPGAGAPRVRRPARPIWGIYTPINADWPADYLWWGQPGYEVEFVRCLQQFDQHFRDRGWLSTRPMFFFNHKKRYRWYAWDGDEAKHAKDHAYLVEMGRLLDKAVGDSPVPWCYRMDASWQMSRQFDEFAGMIGLWVCANFIRWYPEACRAVIRRGEAVWTYSGTPPIAESSAALLEHTFVAWARGLQGHCEWLTNRPGDDPWFDCDGAATGMLYPGDRFGIRGPIPSARLKIQRNAVQDLTLLAARADVREVADQLAGRAGLSLWEAPPRVVVEEPPEAWDDTNLKSSDESMEDHRVSDPLWWRPVRDAAMAGGAS